MVHRPLNRRASSLECSRAHGQSRAPQETAPRAPHAPYEADNRAACAKGRDESGRTPSSIDAGKQLRLTVSDLKHVAVGAASVGLNLVGKAASARVCREHVPVPLCSAPITEPNRSARIHGLRSIVVSPKWSVNRRGTKGQLRSELAADAPRTKTIPPLEGRPVRSPVQRSGLRESFFESDIATFSGVRRAVATAYSFKITPSRH